MKVVALLAEKGGVGKSLSAVALAAATVRQGKRTVLVDLDPLVHTLDLYTGMQDRAILWLDDLFSEKCVLKDLLLKDEALDGLYLAPAPSDAACLTAENGKIFRELLEKDLPVDYLILDLPARCAAAFSFAEAIADVFLVLSDESDVSLLAAEITAERIRGREGYLLLNRFNLYPRLIEKRVCKKVSEMIDAVHLPLIAIIPEEEELRHMADEGTLQFAKGEAVLPFENLAYRLNGGQRLLFDGMRNGKKIRRSL